MIVTGGMRVRNAKTLASGTLGIIVRKQTGESVGITNYHVLYGTENGNKASFGDPVEVFNEDGTFVKIGTLGEGKSILDISLVTIKLDKDIDFRHYEIMGRMISKLGVSKANLKKFTPLSKFGAGANDWRIARVQGGKKVRINILGTPTISVGGDSGSIWLTGSEPYKACGVHYWGATGGHNAHAKNMNKVVQAFNLKMKP